MWLTDRAWYSEAFEGGRWPAQEVSGRTRPNRGRDTSAWLPLPVSTALPMDCPRSRSPRQTRQLRLESLPSDGGAAREAVRSIYAWGTAVLAAVVAGIAVARRRRQRRWEYHLLARKEALSCFTLADTRGAEDPYPVLKLTPAAR